jgi:two-component system KDP operon response regulator KdpE
MLRRSTPTDPGETNPVYLMGDIRIHFETRQVFRGEDEIHLTPIEYKLLTTLIHHRGKVMTHRQLLMEVWGPSHSDQNHYLRIYILQLRRKIETDPNRPRYILTEPGIGYRLKEE